MEVSVHIVVKGLVQGVGYRWFVARRAQALGLHGYVKNRIDGDVELEATGDRSLLEELIKEARTGPRSAHVSDMQIEWQQASFQYTHFEIR